MRVAAPVFLRTECGVRFGVLADSVMHGGMLPILRIIPVGGVLLAIMILALALEPPGGSHTALTPAVMPARGALMRTNEHPEWRQFLMQAAVRRADELSRLRELPDTPVRSDSAPDDAKVADKIAGLPTSRSDSDPDDETGTIAEMPSATVPLKIGEISSTELPATPPEQEPPAIRTPERVKLPSETRKRPVLRARRIKASAKPEPAVGFNLLEALFGGPQTKQSAVGRPQTNQPATVRADPQ